MKFILKVEDAFDLSGIGCVISPPIPENLGFVVRPKDQIQLRTPEGRVLDTHIQEFSSYRPRPGRRRFYEIVLPAQFSQSDIPVGTEVWLSQGV